MAFSAGTCPAEEMPAPATAVAARVVTSDFSDTKTLLGSLGQSKLLAVNLQVWYDLPAGFKENLEFRMADPAPAAPAFQIQSSRHFAAFLAAQRTSLAFTTYQSGKLFLIGLKPTGELSIFERTFNRCMGLWADGQTLWMSHGLAALALRERARARARSTTASTGSTCRARATRPATSTCTTSPWTRTGASSSSTRCSRCLATVSDDGTASARSGGRRSSSRLAAEDRCHLNGLALEDGAPALRHRRGAQRTWPTAGASAAATAASSSTWTRGEIVVAGLSMPHSPRLHRRPAVAARLRHRLLRQRRPRSAARSSRSRSVPATRAAWHSSATTRSSACRKPRDGTFSGLRARREPGGAGRRGRAAACRSSTSRPATPSTGCASRAWSRSCTTWSRCPASCGRRRWASRPTRSATR